MALAAGARLGHYEVLGLIAAGGMGEVYSARDPRLNREVAIKVLPNEVAGDAGYARRFEDEARAAAALNHPNILAIFDVGVEDVGPFIVTELLKGQTLHDFMAGSPLPRALAVHFAMQIARGIAAAHGRGIVHRDVKPSNIFVTTDRQIKILDFGLAKLTAPIGAVTHDSATRTTNTLPGTVLGSAGYMSPEQVRGQSIDSRTDIFSFGAVFYEMLSGKRAFSGTTAADSMIAILRGSNKTSV